MYCQKCGKQIENDSNFCKHCGTKIEKKKKNYMAFIILGIIMVIITFIGAITLGKKLAYYINNSNDHKIETDKYYDNFYDNDEHDNDFFDFDDEDTYDKEDDYKKDVENFEEIDIDKFLELKKGSTPSIILLGEERNISCYQQLLYLYSIAKRYNIKINYLNLSDFETKEYETLKSSDEMFNSPWDIPLLLIVQNDKIIDKKEGVQTGKTLLEFFSNNNLLGNKNND